MRMFRLRIPFKMAALGSKFRPKAFFLAHTAIFELPRSTMLDAGCENCGDSRDVMRNSRSRRFFFCTHECSPSISATARLRFLEADIGGRGRNVSFMAGGGSKMNGNVAELLAVQTVPGCWFNVDGVLSVPARNILRYPNSCTILGKE